MNPKPESSDNDPRKPYHTVLTAIQKWSPVAWPFLAALIAFLVASESAVVIPFLNLGNDKAPCDGGLFSREAGVWGLLVVGILYLWFTSDELKHRKKRGFLGPAKPGWLPFIVFYTLPVIALIHFFDAKLMTGGFALADCPSCWTKQMLFPQGIDPFSISIWDNDPRFVFCHLEDGYCGKMDFLPFWGAWLGLYLVSASVLQWLRILAWKLRHDYPSRIPKAPNFLHKLEARALTLFSVVFLVITLATAWDLRQQNGSTLAPPETCKICNNPAGNCPPPPVKRAP